jgi:hypothetical protein
MNMGMDMSIDKYRMYMDVDVDTEINTDMGTDMETAMDTGTEKNTFMDMDILKGHQNN